MAFQKFEIQKKGCFKRSGKFVSVGISRLSVSLDVQLDITKKYDILYDQAIKAIILEESESGRKFHTQKSSTYTMTTAFHKVMPKGRYYWDDNAKYYKLKEIKDENQTT